jgi:DNA-directed RNA polymerase specialized sigma24 family protein
MALMESQLKTKKKDWQITQEGFDKLLALFDEDRERAAMRYEEFRRRLLKFFEWRGSLTPEEHADETFNRVARKLTEGVLINDAGSFIGGVARLLVFEMLEERKREQKAFENFTTEPAINIEIEEEETDERVGCFRSCLNGLPADQRSLIIDYYREDEQTRIKQRKALADRLGIPLNALRIRAHRVRTQLDKCIRNCMNQ